MFLKLNKFAFSINQSINFNLSKIYKRITYKIQQLILIHRKIFNSWWHTREFSNIWGNLLYNYVKIFARCHILGQIKNSKKNLGIFNWDLPEGHVFPDNDIFVVVYTDSRQHYGNRDREGVGGKRRRVFWPHHDHRHRHCLKHALPPTFWNYMNPTQESRTPFHPHL